MDTFKNIGLVESSVSGKIFQLSATSNMNGNGYNLKKVFINGSLTEGLARSLYPKAELVQDIHSILNDASIDLVLISAPQGYDSKLFSQVLESGKHVRIV
jgi:hypothetical protein